MRYQWSERRIQLQVEKSVLSTYYSRLIPHRQSKEIVDQWREASFKKEKKTLTLAGVS